MPRIRTIKPDFFADEKLSKLKREHRLLYIGLWVFSDDYGTVRSNATWIKSNVFPYDEDLRVNDVQNALDALVKARMLEPFKYNGEGFYNIRTFDVHQKVEKKSKPVVPLAEKERTLKQSGNSRGIVGEYSEPEVVHSTEDLVNDLPPNGGRDSGESPETPQPLKKPEERNLKSEYAELQKSFTGKEMKDVYNDLKTFLNEKKPDFAEPFVDAWNYFADKNGLARVVKITGLRKNKIRTRTREPDFHFIDILNAIRRDKFYLGDNGKDGAWKITFDHIIESENNYIKILEKQNA